MKYLIFVLTLCTRLLQAQFIPQQEDHGVYLTDSIQQGLIRLPAPAGNNKDFHTTPFNQLNSYNNWAIKAKVLPWMALIAAGMNYSAGLEFGFCKNHSLGIDLFINNYSYDPPDVYDSATNAYNGGYRQMIRDRALLLHYRYYLPFQKLREQEGISLYAGSFLRYGKVHFKYDEGYTRSREIVGETHYSAGLMLGILKEICYFKRLQSPLNLDAYFGIFIKEREMAKRYYDENNILIEDLDHPVLGGMRIGLTLSMALKYKNR